MQSLDNRTKKDLLILVISTLAVTFLLWLPYLLKLESFYQLNFSQGMNLIYRNFDGLEYVIIAKSLYQPELIANLPQSLPTTYYASHFPGYPLLILLVAPILGFLKSMLLVSVVSTIGAIIAFYFLVKNFKLTQKPLILSLVFLILPARWLIVHSVGSSEPTFIFFIILAIYFFMKFEQSTRFLFIYLSALFGLLAQITRPPAMILFFALGVYIIWKIFNEKGYLHIKKVGQIIFSYHPLLLIPLGLVGIFVWYGITYQDFFAYFHSGDNIHLTFPPFQVFNKSQYWVGDIWLEDIVYVFILGIGAGILLFKKKVYPMAFFILTYMLAAIFIAHRDISRYALPTAPFVLIAYEKFLTSKEFRIILIILVLGIYLYAQNFLLNNTVSIPNIEAFN